jgi:hypothetical protein
MYVHLTPEELAIVLKGLSDSNLVDHDPVSGSERVRLRAELYKKYQESQDSAAQALDLAFVTAAQNRHQDDSVCKIDDGALVSKGEDPGAYVMAWLWITNAEAGLTEPFEPEKKT